MVINWLDVQGLYPATLAMRAPLSSWQKSDSVWSDEDIPVYKIGEKDKELSIKLQKAGPEHYKHLRMIIAWANIVAPRYWLTELDTYRAGVEKISTSTMHTLMRRSLQESDFETDCMNKDYIRYFLDSINTSMEAWRAEQDEETKKEIWRSIIEGLPQSFIQPRIYMFSYAALRNIIKQRQGHKLKEWHQFIEACRNLPESWMLFE